MLKKNGGPAFPIRERTEHIDGAIVCDEWNGMSLRDWFAGMAMNSLMQSRIASRKYDEPHEFANMCFQIADAMLKEHEKDYAL